MQFPAGLADIRTFGAVGDGTVDDTDAIQTAINAKRGMIYVPQGRYKISRTIVVDLSVSHRTAIQGAGGTIINAGQGPALFIRGHHEGTAAPKTVVPSIYESEVMPYVDGLHITGEHPEADGISIEGTFKIVISHVLIHKCRYGLHLSKCNRDVIIDSCHIYDNSKIGVFLDEVDLHQINILGSHISYNKQGGIKVVGGGIRNLQINGSDIEYNHADGGKDIWIVCGPGGVREGAITGNTIQALAGSGGANILIEGYAPSSPNESGYFSICSNHIANQADSNIAIKDCRGIVISGNTIKGATRQITAENTQNIIISNNCLDDNPKYGAYSLIGGISLRNCRYCTVQGVIAGTPQGGDATAGGAIEAYDCAGINISNCSLIGPRYRGIWLENVRDSHIANCIILRPDTSSPMLAAIVEAGVSNGNLITNNRIQSGEEGAIIVRGDKTLCQGNLID